MGDQTGDGFARFAQAIEEFFRQLLVILMALPRAPAAFAQAFETVFASASGARGPGLTLAILVLCIVATLAPGRLIRARPLDPAFVKGTRFALVGRVLINDFIDIGAAALVATLAAALIFKSGTALDKMAVGILWAVVRWRACVYGIEIFLLPVHAHGRDVIVPPDAARRTIFWASWAFGLTLLFVSVVPILLLNQLEIDPARAVAFIRACIDCAFSIAAVRAFASGLSARQRPVLAGGIAASLVYLAVWTYSLVQLDFTLYDAFTGAVGLVWIYFILKRLGLLATHPVAQGSGAADLSVTDPVSEKPETSRHDIIVGAARRCLLMLYCAIAVTLIDRIWLVDLTHITEPDHWPIAASAIRRALFMALAGYVGYEALHTWSSVKFGPERVIAVPGLEDTDNEISTGSRLATLLPLLSRILLVFSLGIALLVGMADYGINIGPILAGAGIFGLAISFGSQALVRDIVSGFFYIFDDAFRVGEYIDTGKQKGTVERISLRSLRLRHQNGQVHTVPYGQLSTVTNFSRDWTTVKFNLRVSRDNDLDKVRKVAKKTGLAMLDDEEIGREFLAPLKMQGVADVLDNALLLRFKFTCLPVRSSYCQREAVKRLYKDFVAADIKFAVNSVTVIAEAMRSAEGLAPDVVKAAATVGAVQAGPALLPRAGEGGAA